MANLKRSRKPTNTNKLKKTTARQIQSQQTQYTKKQEYNFLSKPLAYNMAAMTRRSNNNNNEQSDGSTNTTTTSTSVSTNDKQPQVPLVDISNMRKKLQENNRSKTGKGTLIGALFSTPSSSSSSSQQPPPSSN